MSRFPFTPSWRYSWLACLLPCALLLASCGQNADAGQTSAGAGGTTAQVCDIQASWAMGYHSLKELKQATELDIAVQGTFAAIQGTQGQAPSSGSSDLLSTDFSFTISKVLLDPHHLLNSSSSSVTIRQTGGRVGNTLHQVCDDPLFRIGEEAILFLHQFSSDQYFVMGGPSGRFEARQGLVQPVNDEGVKLPAGLSEQQFYAMLQEA